MPTGGTDVGVAGWGWSKNVSTWVPADILDIACTAVDSCSCTSNQAAGLLGGVFVCRANCFQDVRVGDSVQRLLRHPSPPCLPFPLHCGGNLNCAKLLLDITPSRKHSHKDSAAVHVEVFSESMEVRPVLPHCPVSVPLHLPCTLAGFTSIHSKRP